MMKCACLRNANLQNGNAITEGINWRTGCNMIFNFITESIKLSYVLFKKNCVLVLNVIGYENQQLLARTQSERELINN